MGNKLLTACFLSCDTQRLAWDSDPLLHLLWIYMFAEVRQRWARGAISTGLRAYREGSFPGEVLEASRLSRCWLLSDVVVILALS